MNSKNEKIKITLAKNGPILVNGPIHLENDRGEKIDTGSSCALCRCGGSNNKPFCDGSHLKLGFAG